MRQCVIGQSPRTSRSCKEPAINPHEHQPAWDPRWIQWPPEGDESIREALLRAYEDGSWGRYHGPNVEELERQLAAFHGVHGSLTCASGTIGVQIALRALNLPEGSEVLLAAYDFPGNFRAIQEVGLFPVLVDIDPETWCLNVEQVESAITPQTSAIIVSHLHGGIADMRALREIADRHQIAIVEDACQATGAMLEESRLGSLGDVGVISFGGSKLLTAGRGGALISDRPDVLQRAKAFCERGNHAFPLSELQAAVLLPQLAKLDDANRIRSEGINHLRRYLSPWQEWFRPVGLRSNTTPAFYKHAWRCDSRERTREITGHVQRTGIPLSTGFLGFVKRPTSQARKSSNLEAARSASEQTIILHHPILSHGATAVDCLAHQMEIMLEACLRN